MPSRSDWPGEELMDEVEWLLDGGESPLMIAQIFHMKPTSIARQASRLKRPKIVAAFPESITKPPLQAHAGGNAPSRWERDYRPPRKCASN